MKKHIKLISAGILLVILLIGGYIYFSQQKPTSEEYAAHPECYDSGGVWATFPDTSADHCFSPGRGLLVTYGCDCGPSKCWDSEKCVKNESYQFEEVIACTNSGGMFKNGKCECPSETYGDDIPLYTYEEETGYCIDAFGLPGGILGEEERAKNPVGEIE